MKTVAVLPDGYTEYYSVDLQKDKRTAVFVNLFAAVIAIIMAFSMCFYIPFATLFSMESGLGAYIVRLLSLIVLTVLYLVLHEAVHGVAMKLCGTEKVKYGFTGLYAFAGSDDYYGKKAYIFIAMAPVVFWGAVLAAINVFVPEEWFWVIYFIQIINVSGAAGDIFVTVKFSRFPKDILIKDSGVGMTVYSKENG